MIALRKGGKEYVQFGLEIPSAWAHSTTPTPRTHPFRRLCDRYTTMTWLPAERLATCGRKTSAEPASKRRVRAYDEGADTMPEPAPVHITVDRRRNARPARLHCVGGPLNGHRLYVWPVEPEVPLRHGRYERYPIDDVVVRNATSAAHPKPSCIRFIRPSSVWSR